MSKIRIYVPEAPLNVEACAAEAHSVGLGRAPHSAEHRFFIFFTSADTPEHGVVLHVSRTNAGFLRDALDAVLEQYRIIQDNAN